MWYQLQRSSNSSNGEAHNSVRMGCAHIIQAYRWINAVACLHGLCSYNSGIEMDQRRSVPAWDDTHGE